VVAVGEQTALQLARGVADVLRAYLVSSGTSLVITSPCASTSASSERARAGRSSTCQGSRDFATAISTGHSGRWTYVSLREMSFTSSVSGRRRSAWQTS
jgi:hypothetical protein